MLGWRYRPSRRVIIAVATAAAIVAATLLTLGVVYPAVGERAIRDQVADRARSRLGRDVHIGDVDVDLGHAVLRDLEIRGPADGDAPLVKVDRVDVEFAALPSLVGRARISRAVIDGVTVSLRRGADGVDNVRDLIDKLAGGDGGSGGGGGGGTRPDRVELRRLRGSFVDEGSGVKVVVGDGDGEVVAGRQRATLRGIELTTAAGPRAGIEGLTVTRADGARTIAVRGGSLTPWRGLALTGVQGTIGDGSEAGRFAVALEGGYGGVDETLWTAKGWVSPVTSSASIAVEAARFHLDRLRPILEDSALVRYDQTSVDARLQVDVTRATAKFAAGFHLHDLTIGHPLLAAQEVPALDISGDIVGSYDRSGRVLVLERGDFLSRGLPFSITGQVALPGGLLADGTRRLTRAVSGRVVVPPVPCQQALAAIPPEMAPYLTGFRLTGTFATDVRVAIDWSNLEATVLDGSVGIYKCKVKEAPPEVGERFLEPFEHYVEIEKDEWMSFVIGPENPDFAPISEISPYLVKAVLTTEDSAFYQHRGFLPKEFRSALVKNLQAGYFKYGASSITMQLVKNILLYREKTLARKFQELFLTWYLETVLEKDRMLEIYFNAIEYGPGLYGIGPAAREYFGKLPRDIGVREAAFFATILPSPKARYKQYCEGTLTRWTQDKIDRILKLEVERGRLTEEEYQLGLASPLVFASNGLETVDECLKRVKKAIKNSRPTNPMKKQPAGAPPPGPPAKK
jgi:hypothetical protein